jgi:hypothetical protein
MNRLTLTAPGETTEMMSRANRPTDQESELDESVASDEGGRMGRARFGAANASEPSCEAKLIRLTVPIAVARISFFLLDMTLPRCPCLRVAWSERPIGGTFGAVKLAPVKFVSGHLARSQGRLWSG